MLKGYEHRIVFWMEVKIMLTHQGNTWQCIEEYEQHTPTHKQTFISTPNTMTTRKSKPSH